MKLIFGANGKLGTDFKELFDSIGEKYIATDKDEVDITNGDFLRAYIKTMHQNYKIDTIINCAAYNDVDKAEIDEKVKLLNIIAPYKLAEFARKINAVYITYSTDFVFDGQKKEPYTEEDIPNPLSEYGKSKYEGEQKVLKTYDKSFVIRTSWVFGIANNNFNKQVINWSKSRDALNIVDDQVSVPTYSKDLAEFSWKLIQTEKYGLYHISNEGIASKYDQAKYVLEKIGWKGKIVTAKTEDFNLPAKRPHFSKLSSMKVEKLLGEKIPSWQSGIDRFLEEMKEKGEL